MVPPRVGFSVEGVSLWRKDFHGVDSSAFADGPKRRRGLEAGKSGEGQTEKPGATFVMVFRSNEVIVWCFFRALIPQGKPWSSGGYCRRVCDFCDEDDGCRETRWICDLLSTSSSSRVSEGKTEQMREDLNGFQKQ